MRERLLRRLYVVPVFMNLGRLLFWMARFDRLERPALRLARLYATWVDRTHRTRPGDSPRELAVEWNRLMPSPRSAFPVTDVDEDTAYVEIRAACPLRGTGDALACWRSMEFDRALVAKAGGQLVVMESQSVTGGPCCKLAIRTEGASMDDLPVAHPRWRT